VHQQRVEALALGLDQAHRPQPLGRDAAGGGLPLADLVAVDDQNVGTGAGKLACHGQSGEAGAADQDVATAVQRSPLVAPFGSSNWHRVDSAIIRRRVPDRHIDCACARWLAR
jgi:hypothetical protein